MKTLYFATSNKWKFNQAKNYFAERVLIPEGYSKTFAEFSEKEMREYNEKIWKPTVFDEFINWVKSRQLCN